MRPIRTLLLVLGLGLAGCGGVAFDVSRPDDYLELRGDHALYAYRATSADGVRFAVRELDNEGHGSAAFWARAVRNQLTYEGGYAVLAEEPIRAASGQEGLLLRCGKDQAGRTFDYWIAVFVTDAFVHVVEAGGPRTQFEPERERLLAAFRSLRID